MPTPTERQKDYRDRVSPTADSPPKILWNAPNGRGMVVVAWSLPGLRRAHLAVPEDRWQAGGHWAAGRPLAELVAALDLQAYRIGSRLPGE